MTSQVDFIYAEENSEIALGAPSREGGLDQSSAMTVPIRSLHPSDSPRLAGENVEHARALAESVAILPPILVHRATMRVIDGMHRLRAAEMRNEDEIEVRFFEGDEADAFVAAVQANIAHGLPLSLADRTASAERIIKTHTQWSDRMIASVTGLAANTVGAIRRRATEQTAQLHSRIGRDGRVRPVNSAEGRRLASDLIINKPPSSLREVSKAAGISPGTVRDVRERLSRGEDPVPLAQHQTKNRKDQPKRNRQTSLTEDKTARQAPIRDSNSLLQMLRKDPSLRFAETGRVLLRLLDTHAIGKEQRDELIDNIPPHCTGIVAELARRCAETWQEFAEQLDRGRRVNGKPIVTA